MQKKWPIYINKLTYQLSKQWVWVINIPLLLFVSLPWFAPFFMEIGWSRAGRAIYQLYIVACHQMPQRSFFLFGEQIMYSLSDIQTVWQNTTNPLLLRQFIGNADMGWKVAWSDRMVFMYATPLILGAIYWPFRRRIKPLSVGLFLLFMFPMFIDGVTHMISDIVGGIGGGFRDHNQWLAILTNHAFSQTFYEGDQLGSFNSWMRLLTGVFFGIGVVGFFYPRFNEAFEETAVRIAHKFQQAGISL